MCLSTKCFSVFFSSGFEKKYIATQIGVTDVANYTANIKAAAGFIALPAIEKQTSANDHRKQDYKKSFSKLDHES